MKTINPLDIVGALIEQIEQVEKEATNNSLCSATHARHINREVETLKSHPCLTEQACLQTLQRIHLITKKLRITTP